ncbi:aminotransferase DegT, partial [Clostridiales bacterium AHG0011]|nr:aminotransferase DegT [Clostridiales bacterium AHG0011]
YKIVKAYDYWMHVVNIPCSSNLSKEDVHTVVGLLDKGNKVK